MKLILSFTEICLSLMGMTFVGQQSRGFVVTTGGGKGGGRGRVMSFIFEGSVYACMYRTFLPNGDSSKWRRSVSVTGSHNLLTGKNSYCVVEDKGVYKKRL